MMAAHWNLLAGLGLGFLAIHLERMDGRLILLSLGWVWGVVFLVAWQVVLGYLYVRFRKLVKSNK